MTYVKEISTLDWCLFSKPQVLCWFRTQKKLVERWYLCRVLVFSRKTVNKLFLVYVTFCSIIKHATKFLTWYLRDGGGGSNSLYISTSGGFDLGGNYMISMYSISAVVTQISFLWGGHCCTAKCHLFTQAVTCWNLPVLF